MAMVSSPQLQQTGASHAQQPVVLLEVADGFRSRWLKARFVHVDGVADELVNVPVITGPELDAPLAPGGDDVQTPLQGVGQLLDVEQIITPWAAS
jgi:hypothetical protein